MKNLHLTLIAPNCFVSPAPKNANGNRFFFFFSFEEWFLFKMFLLNYL